MDADLRSPLLRVLIYGHVWLACGALAQTWLMQHLMGLSGWRAPLLAALATFAGYTFMRTARAGHPSLGVAPQLQWTLRHRTVLVGVASIAAIAALVVAAHHLPDLVLRSAPVALAVLLYAVPARWVRGRPLGLGRVPLLRAFLTAGCGAGTTVHLPLLFAPTDHPPQGTGWLFVLQGCFFLSLALVFDLRDRAIDRDVVLTVPQLLGGTGTRSLATLLMLYPVGVFTTLAFVGRALRPVDAPAPWPMDMVLAAVAYLVVAAMVALPVEGRSALHFGLLLDGALLLPPLGVALTLLV